MFHHIDTEQGVGLIGGTLAAIISKLLLHNILETIFFSAIGAATSFFITLGLKCILKKFKK